MKMINLKIPNGMTIRLHTDGFTWLYLADHDIVRARDWLAELTNELTKESLDYLDQRKKEEEQKKLDRLNRIKKIVEPVETINQEKQKISNTPIKPMTPDVPSELLTEPKSNERRIVHTDKGVLDVAIDVTDNEIMAKGYTIVKNHDGDNSESNDSPSALHTH